VNPTAAAPTTPIELEPRRGWVVVWACFTALAVIFGVSYSFAAFFEPFADEFQASRAQVSLVFGFSGCCTPARRSAEDDGRDRLEARVAYGAALDGLEQVVEGFEICSTLERVT
jgi:hypothetical protein